MSSMSNIKFTTNLDAFYQNLPTNIPTNQNPVILDEIAALPKGGDKKQSAEKEVALIAREVIQGKKEINFSGKTYLVSQCFYLNNKLNSFLEKSGSSKRIIIGFMAHGSAGVIYGEISKEKISGNKRFIIFKENEEISNVSDGMIGLSDGLDTTVIRNKTALRDLGNWQRLMFEKKHFPGESSNTARILTLFLKEYGINSTDKFTKNTTMLTQEYSDCVLHHESGHFKTSKTDSTYKSFATGISGGENWILSFTEVLADLNTLQHLIDLSKIDKPKASRMVLLWAASRSQTSGNKYKDFYFNLTLTCILSSMQKDKSGKTTIDFEKLQSSKNIIHNKVSKSLKSVTDYIKRSIKKLFNPEKFGKEKLALQNKLRKDGIPEEMLEFAFWKLVYAFVKEKRPGVDGQINQYLENVKQNVELDILNDKTIFGGNAGKHTTLSGYINQKIAQLKI